MKLPELISVPNIIIGATSGDPIDVMAKLFLKDVDGEHTIADIGDGLGLEPQMAQRIALSLIKKGLLEISGFELEKTIPPKPPEPKKEAPPPEEVSARIDKHRILKAEVDELFNTLNEKNFYELLDTEPDASRGDLRSKYFSLSKRFHPDKAFGDTTGQLRKKMEVIFRHLTQAYDILSNPKSRADYDSSIADIIEMWAIEKKLKEAVQGEGKPEPDKTSAGRKMKISGLNATARSRPRALKTRGKTEKKQPSHPPKPHYEDRRQQWRRERAGRAMAELLGRHSNTPPSPGKPKLRIHEAEIALEQDRFSEAVRLLQEALTIDPGNEMVVQMLERARAGSVAALAKEHVSKGLFEQRQGNLSVAIKHFSQAVDNDPGNLDARHLLAEALVLSQKELPKALSLMREVVSMGGQRARYFGTLGDILLLAKDTDKAREAFERAAQLAPENKDYKKKLKMCKK